MRRGMRVMSPWSRSRRKSYVIRPAVIAAASVKSAGSCALSSAWEPPTGEQAKGDECAEEGLDPGLAEAERGGALAVVDARPMELGEHRVAYGAIMASRSTSRSRRLA
jgi:hypothetical protein